MKFRVSPGAQVTLFGPALFYTGPGAVPGGDHVSEPTGPQAPAEIWHCSAILAQGWQAAFLHTAPPFCNISSPSASPQGLVWLDPPVYTYHKEMCSTISPQCRDQTGKDLRGPKVFSHGTKLFHCKPLVCTGITHLLLVWEGDQML